MGLEKSLEGNTAVISSASKLLLVEMVENQLLTPDPQLGRSAAIAATGPCPRELPRAERGKTLRLCHVRSFLKAYIVATVMLRLAPIERVVARVAARRAKHDSPLDLAKASSLLEIYLNLRPFVMSRRDRCLLNSLLLIEFLSANGVFPAWHFGVRLREFSAHCWVEANGILLDEDVEIVSRYVTIMTV